MSDKGLPSPEPRADIAPFDLDVEIKKRQKVLNSLVEKLKPWLVEFGTWIFGGLIAFNLVIVATLITVGPSHPSILVSMAAFAGALPLNVLGLFLLKLIKDMNDVEIDDMMRQAFQEADISNSDAYLPAQEDKQAVYKRRTDVGLRYSSVLATLSAVLTILGLAAALWYMAWWVSVIFCVMLIISLVIATYAFAHLMPSETEAEKKLKQYYQEQRTRRTNEKRKAK